MPLEDVFGI